MPHSLSWVASGLWLVSTPQSNRCPRAPDQAVASLIGAALPPSPGRQPATLFDCTDARSRYKSCGAPPIPDQSEPRAVCGGLRGVGGVVDSMDKARLQIESRIYRDAVGEKPDGKWSLLKAMLGEPG